MHETGTTFFIFNFALEFSRGFSLLLFPALDLVRPNRGFGTAGTKRAESAINDLIVLEMAVVKKRGHVLSKGKNF